MKDLKKYTKAELIRLAKACESDVENAKNEAMTAHRSHNKVVEELNNKKADIRRLKAQIERIHQSIQTVVRMKYPDHGVYHNGPQMATDKVTDVPERPEEMSLLLYLTELCIVERPQDMEELLRRRY